MAVSMFLYVCASNEESFVHTCYFKMFLFSSYGEKGVIGAYRGARTIGLTWGVISGEICRGPSHKSQRGGSCDGLNNVRAP